MTTHIDYAETEVIAHDEPRSSQGKGGGSEPQWRLANQIRRALDRHKALEYRVRAEGFDD